MQDFSRNLAEARKKAGLSQADCAHLLGVSQSHISHLERGYRTPSVTDLCGVAVLFGRSMEFMVEPLFRECAATIYGHLFDLPERRRGWFGQFVRTNALDNIEARLDRIMSQYDR